ncbi:MAG: hypothetical protein KDJ47_14335 [Hyphomicrobiaceae bacterium]|nr:hypothetical protein [Hyphomicrobiaceae bacterium]
MLGRSFRFCDIAILFVVMTLGCIIPSAAVPALAGISGEAGQVEFSLADAETVSTVQAAAAQQVRFAFAPSMHAPVRASFGVGGTPQGLQSVEPTHFAAALAMIALSLGGIWLMRSSSSGTGEAVTGRATAESLAGAVQSFTVLPDAPSGEPMPSSGSFATRERHAVALRRGFGRR